MTGGANRFYKAIPDIGSRRSADLIGYFVYYLTVEASEPFATPAAIDRCFSDCDLPPPANTSARLRENLKGPSAKYVRVAGGYRLHRNFRDSIAAGLGEMRVTFQTNETLRRLEGRFGIGNEKAFLGELISCFEVGANRATIIMCWILTIDHLYDYVLAHHIAAFNDALSKVTDKRVKASKIHTRDDFGDIPENKFIELLRVSGVISNDVRKILDEKLGTRNSCAHPSGVAIKPSKVIEFVDDLVENIVLKYQI